MTTNRPYDVIVIGGGQAGLAAGYYLQQAGVRFVILEADDKVGGSWPHYYESLRIFSPASYSNLPGLPFLGAGDHYPTRDDVTAYLRKYANYFHLPVVTEAKVERVTYKADQFQVETAVNLYTARAVIAASGSFNKPHIPDLPGMDTFQGTVLHAFDYQRPSAFKGQRVIVVGAGNSAVQIAAELAQVARVSLAARREIAWIPQRIGGKDIHFWFRVTGFDALRLGHENDNGRRPVLDSGRYKAALEAGLFEQRPLFQHFTEDGVVWSDGLAEAVDAVILATGYRPNLDYLAPLGVLDETGNVQHKKGVSLDRPGLYFNGLPFQRNHASATLRGSGPDAQALLNHLLPYLKKKGALVGVHKRQPWARLKAAYCRQFC